MADDGLAIIIKGRREDWPGGARTLTPLPPLPRGKPFRGAHWFGAELDPDRSEVWFRITGKDIHRMREKTPRARGARLIDELITWMTSDDRQLGSDLPDFEVKVSHDGNAWIEQR